MLFSKYKIFIYWFLLFQMIYYTYIIIMCAVNSGLVTIIVYWFIAECYALRLLAQQYN